MDENRLTADVLLALTNPTTGAAVLDSSHLQPLLAGAAITELVLRGALMLDGNGTLTLGRAPMPVDARWTEVVSRSVGRTPAKAIGRVGGTSSYRDRTTPLRAAATEELANRGVARDASTLMFGLFPRRRLEILRPDARVALLGRVSQVLDAGEGPRHDHAVTSMLAASGALPKLFPDLDRRWLERRAARIAAGDWAGAALQSAVRDVMLAQAAAVWAVAASTIASTTSN